ncbi:hypothetical protein CHRYSEOSP005_28890 [Chryseobacterium sp. Alg-005]|uniref:T9SS type A sorting domain-containing protein n=1 Tax=Chryseobacterium sp. Alg-005 TaxID=3159516 RepID=UPI0035559114
MRKNLLFCLSFLTAIFMNAQNDNCSGATTLTVGTTFASGAITSTNVGATTDGTSASCDSNAAENVWFKVVVPASGKLKIETREVSTSLFDDSVLTVYTGSCGTLTEIDCDDDGGQGAFSLLSLTGQTPGTTLYISVWKYDSTIDSGEFQISAFDPIPATNDNCAQAVSLTVGTNFASGAITSTNLGASTDGTIPSCSSDAVENVWYTVIVPASGNLTIETQGVSGSQYDDTVVTVYSGTCGSLTQIGCDDDSGTGVFSLITLTGQTPGATLYVSAWKYDSGVGNGEFQISAYDTSALSTHEVAENKNKIKVSPNPFHEMLTISDVSDVKSVTVLDASGKLIKTIEKPSSSLYLGDLKQGLYLLTLKMNDGTVKTIKTIKK